MQGTDPVQAEPVAATAAGVPGLLIRATRVSDAEGLAQLSNRPGVRRGTLRIPFESEDIWRTRIDRLTQNAITLVAELDGVLVGTAGLHRPEAARRTHSATLGIMVDDAFQGRGIGKALLAAQIDLADNWLNLIRLDLMVYVDNAVAIAL